MKIINVVAAAIINDQEQILCFQRGPGRSLANKWEFPGGKIETGESEETALIREINEELHADLTIIRFVDQASYDYDFGTVNMKVYLGTIKDNQFSLTEHLQAKWVHKQDLMSMDWAPVDIPIARTLSEGK